MNLKKMLLSLVTMVIFVVLVTVQGVTYAETLPAGQEVYMGIKNLMENNEPHMGYSINTAGTDNGVKIWNIVRYDSATSPTYHNNNIYCVRSGVGFTGTTAKDGERRSYNVNYNMKTDREAIRTHKDKTGAQNTVLQQLVEANIKDTDVNRYNAVLAVLDNLYLPGKSTEGEKKELIYTLIKSATKDPDYMHHGNPAHMIDAFEDAPGVETFVNENNPTKYKLTEEALTDNDINAVQQSVLWYFTNSDQEAMKFDKTNGEQQWLHYTLDGNNYTNSLASYNATRNEQAEVLYNYMIRQAKENASSYANISSTSGAPATVDTTTLNGELSGENYIMGPIHITEANSTPYTIDFNVKNNGNEISNYQLLDENKNAVKTGTTVKDLVGKNFYITVPKNQVDALTIDITINYNDTKMTLWTSSENNGEQPLVEVDQKPESVPAQLKFQPKKQFDLALRKYITKVERNGKEISIASRIPNIDEDSLTSGTTATYKHKKDPVTVATGDTVTYKMTIYNEAEKQGRATKVIDQLPTGLKFSKVVSGNFEKSSYDETTNTLLLTRKADNETNLPAYTKGSLTSGTGTETIEIECTVTATPDTKSNKVLTNVAWIAAAIEEGVEDAPPEGTDRDSQPSTSPDVNKDNMSNYIGKDNKTDLTDSNFYYKGQQDDDDFEKLVLLPESFDLKLIKRITAVNDQNVPERIEKIDVSKLNTSGTDSKTTADYQLNKEPVGVAKGDIVTYTFRIYNEGMTDGYAQEITEDVPQGLQFLWSEKEGDELKKDTTLTDEEKKAIEFNQKYLWGKFVYDDKKENIIQISSDYLSKANETTAGGNLIKAFGHNDGSKTEKDLSYKELSVKFKVVSEDKAGKVIRNEAAITEDGDKDGNPVDDRDSETDKWVKYEDDEDYDNIILQSFDLALRKFIIAISDDTKIENNEYLKNEDGSYTRAPVVDTSKLNTIGEDGKLITTATYNHTKEPIIVKPNDIVVYMLRVYNEGDIDGYAAEIKDHLPPYLEFVNDEFNKQYGWEVSEDGRTVTTKYLENSLIKAAQQLSSSGGTGVEKQSYELSYKEVPIMCKVNEKAKSSENITNIADITKYLDKNKNPITDRDSQENNVKLPEDKDLPGYKDNEKGSYVPGQQDDDDFEKVNVKIFDLALRKWVTQAIVIENGKQTVTQTGHDAWDDPEAVVKVELHRKKLDQVTVKFRYSIRVYNQGEIEGYAKEITDYVPQGLKFVAQDNPGWTDEGNNIISTRLLENTLLQPGEYADVEVLLTWINGENNMGVMNNTAEISEDYNKYGVPDIDSTPNNKKAGEDDIDDAPVMLSISTGQMRVYFTLGFVMLITTAGGVFLIKKFVL